MKTEFGNINLLTNKKEIKVENKLIDLTKDQLIDLVKKGGITRDLLLAEAVRNKTSISKVSIAIIIKCGLVDKYIQYEDESTKDRTIENSKSLFVSFLEKQQQPDMIEQEPQMPDVSTTSVSPATLPADEPQPDVVPLQVPEIPNLEPSPAPEIIPSTQSAENITNPERKNWWEVERGTEVMAIEDLSGDIKTFEKHVKELGVAKMDASGNWQWTGDNKKLVFLGDILGDRKMNGMKIASIIGNLSEQAEKKDGQVDFLCGNHEMEFIHFLFKDIDNYAEKNSNHFTRQSIGIWELVEFDPDPNSELKATKPLVRDDSEEIRKEFERHENKLWPELHEKMPEIIENMKNNPKGLRILENICKIKVAVVHDDTLYCHTDPTARMIFDLTKDGDISRRVMEINTIFQNNLRRVIFENKKLDDNFRYIEDVYLNADNREYFTDQNSAVVLANNLLYRLSKKIDRIEREKNIEEWKNDHGLIGEYINEVNKIFDADKSKNKKQKKTKIELEDDLIEKIERLNPAGRDVEKIKNSGINAIIHGHSPRRDERFYNENDFVIISPHADFSKGPNIDKGTSIIRKNGKIDLIGKSFRG